MHGAILEKNLVEAIKLQWKTEIKTRYNANRWQ